MPPPVEVFFSPVFVPQQWFDEVEGFFAYELRRVNLTRIRSSKSHIYLQNGAQQWPTFPLSSTPRASSSLLESFTIQPYRAFFFFPFLFPLTQPFWPQPSIKADGDVRRVILTHDVPVSGAPVSGHDGGKISEVTRRVDWAAVCCILWA